MTKQMKRSVPGVNMDAVMLELDMASGETYACGKDGRLYRLGDVAALGRRSLAGDGAARIKLAQVDFSLDDLGQPRGVEAATAAMHTTRAAWAEGAFEALVELGELLPRQKARWTRAGRDRRERAARAHRRRALNSLLTPVGGPGQAVDVTMLTGQLANYDAAAAQACDDDTRDPGKAGKFYVVSVPMF